MAQVARRLEAREALAQARAHCGAHALGERERDPRDRRGPRALGLWSCLDVGTRAMTPAAQAIWRSIRPMVVQSLPTSLAAPLELHEWTFLRRSQ